MTIKEQQKNIIEEFEILGSDFEMTNFHLMDLGLKLPEMPESLKNDENLINGCQSKVWLFAELENEKVKYTADSNTAITKGLVSLLVRVFNHQTPDEIIQEDVYFPAQIGMNRFIGTQRSNGFNAMIKQFKVYAVALKAKKQLKENG